MIIPLTDNLRLSGSEHSWDLQRLYTPKAGSKNPDPYWVSFKYFQSLSGAFDGAFDYERRVIPTEGLADAVATNIALKRRYTELREKFEYEKYKTPC